MNTTTDLRETLARHADLDDHDLSGRAASVRSRIQVVRRRRRAAVAGAAAAIVIAGFGLANLPTADEDAAPATHRVGNVEAPHTIQSLGYTYTFVEGVVAQRDPAGIFDTVARGELPASDEPRLLSWGTPSGRAEGVEVMVRPALGVPDVPFDVLTSDFRDFVVVPTGTVWEFEVRNADAAVYELTGDAAGVTGHGVTFRDTVGSYELRAAEFGDVGGTEVHVEAPGPAGSAAYALHCHSSVFGAQFQVAADDVVVRAGPCIGSLDPADLDVTFRPGPSTPEELELTIRLMQPGTDPWAVDPSATLDDPEAVLGLAVYEVTEPGTSVLGHELHEVVEVGTHTWRLSYVAPITDEDVVRGAAPARVPLLLAVPTSFSGNVSLELVIDSEVVHEFTLPPGGMTRGLLVPEGAEFTVRPHVGHPVQGQLAVAVYAMTG